MDDIPIRRCRESFEEDASNCCCENSRSIRAVYSYEACIGIIMHAEKATYEEAVEHLEFNVVGAYVGVRTPIFVRHISELRGCRSRISPKAGSTWTAEEIEAAKEASKKYDDFFRCECGEMYCRKDHGADNKE